MNLMQVIDSYKISKNHDQRAHYNSSIFRNTLPITSNPLRLSKAKFIEPTDALVIDLFTVSGQSVRDKT
jgi:hypothetical protein